MVMLCDPGRTSNFIVHRLPGKRLHFQLHILANNIIPIVYNKTKRMTQLGNLYLYRNSCGLRGSSGTTDIGQLDLSHNIAAAGHQIVHLPYTQHDFKCTIVYLKPPANMDLMGDVREESICEANSICRHCVLKRG